jgi:hypothetical protein
MGRLATIATLTIFSSPFLLVSGCAPITIPVPVSLTDAGVGEFEVQAGVPKNARANFSFTLGRSGGSGSLSIDPANVSVQTANTTGGKVSALTLQEQNVCLNACLLADVDAATCGEVCTDGELRVTIYIGTQEGIQADCEAGDMFVFEVELDADGNATSILVTPDSVSQDLLDLLNTGSFGACVEVISPVDGTVRVDSLTFNVGL